MKYFLTGGTGFVGSHLAKLLIQKGHEVIAVVRTLSNAKDLIKIGVQLVQGDVSDKESMRDGMIGCDGVFHVAGWYKVGSKDKSQGEIVNVQGTRNVLELMKELKIPKGVYTSTLAINSNTHGKQEDENYRFEGIHLSEYDRSKAAAHKIARDMIEAGLPLVIVMPGIIYGRGDTSSLRTSIIDFLHGNLPMIPDTTAYSWGHVDDIAEAHLLAMEKGKIGEDYMICGPSHTLVEGMKIIAAAANKKMPVVLPALLVKFSSYLVKPFEFLPLPVQYTSEFLRVSGGVTYLGDNSKAKKELGYNPRTLKDALTEVVQHEIKLLAL